MEVSISARHVTITPRLEEVIHEKIGGLDRFLEGLDSAEVHLDEARNPRINDKQFCEVVLVGHGHHVRCKVQAPDPFTAIDRATAKLERQIRKLRTKLIRRHHGDGTTIRTAEARSAQGRGAVGFDDDGGPAGGGSRVGSEDPPGEGGYADDAADQDQHSPRIVKTKRFHLGPLSPDEAVLKMELLGHGFFFFINSETDRSAVVYRREDGDVGLIDEAG